MALGATPGNIVRSVVGEAWVLAVVGVVCGSLALFAATPLLVSLLFGVAAYDTASIVSANLLLLAIAMIAAWGPARRASLLDPSVALRAE
jgi:ABC-type antimicrobial peptide transport system permease subunit